MPNGVHFLFAGGSWSSPLGVSPCASVLHFSPPRVFPLVHLGLDVLGDLQRLRIVLVALVGGSDAVEVGVGLLQLIQWFGLRDASEEVAQAAEEFPPGAVAG